MLDHAANPYRGKDGTPQLRPSVAAFIDLLGYKDFTEKVFREGNSEIELIRLRKALDVAYDHLKDQSKKHGADGKLDFQVRSFTDNLLIGYPIPEHGYSRGILMMVVHYISCLQAELAREGYLIRGAISVGELYVDDDIIFGPALMEAYVAEQRLAVNPRVILCDSAESSCRERSASGTVPDLLVDSDDRVFIDYLDNTVMIAYPDDRAFKEYLEGHKGTVIHNLEQFANKPYIRSKYEWAAVYHNAFCDRYPDVFEASEKIPTALLAPPPKLWVLPPAQAQAVLEKWSKDICDAIKRQVGA